MDSGAIVGENRVDDPVMIVIFGASGDLARRKLIPALYIAYARDLLPSTFTIVGFARRDYDDAIFRGMMAGAIKEFSRIPADDATVARFVEHIHYHKGDISSPAAYAELKEKFRDEAIYPENRLYYLSIMPSLFETAVELLKQSGLVAVPGVGHWTRIVIEKPFGKDIESAKALNAGLLRHLDESQIYRIDHYLGKETVQNILSFRFANAIFEPIFNRSYVDHIQITAAETVGMESARGGYYDEYGAIRDMVTNHMLELLCLVAMEPPGDLSADAIRNEKVKVLAAAKLDIRRDISDAVCRGQYGGGEKDGRHIKGYLEEGRIDPHSQTETFAALRLKINNWRWAGVPVFLRTGKRMAKKTTEIAVQFKVPPLQLFQHVECEEDVCDITGIKPNTLIFRIQPDEGIFLKIGTKRPGMRFAVEDVKMDFSYSGTWDKVLPEAYERLLLDTLHGDSTLFTRSDEVEAEWRVVQPILDNLDKLKPHTYPPCGWGASEADRLFHAVEGSWRNE